MIRDKKVVNSNEYRIEVAGQISEERYKFRIQAWSRKARVASYSGWVPEEFIEDEIDNSKNIEYLEKLTLELVKNHLKDILELPEHTIARNIKYWFREAKRQLDKENKDE